MKYRIVFTNGGWSTVEADSDIKACRLGVEKAYKKPGRELKQVYRLSETGHPEADVNAAIVARVNAWRKGKDAE